MTTDTLTGHAQIRSQQRSVAPFIIDLLLGYGTSTRHRGADTIFFDKAGKKRLRRDLGRKCYSRIEDN